MTSKWLRFLTLGLLVTSLAFAGCGGGSDGRDGIDGADGLDGTDGTDGGNVINASLVSDEFLEGLDVESEITNVVIASPPVVTFTLASSTGVPITGIVPFWEDSNRYVRFTITKLMPGAAGEPNSWVAYTRDADSNAPDYDTGASLVDNGDGSYTFTFLTDVATVDGVPYEPTLTHRVAGQLGSRDVPIEPQNFVYDYVPAGGAVTTTRNIAVMASCNECHDDLVFHGRRFEVEYCVNCHNPDLAEGEGDMAFMTHRIHAAGDFAILDEAISYEELTYPQDLANCRKCHNGDDAATPDGNNWQDIPSIAACSGCHDKLAPTHGGGSACLGCHDDGVAPSPATAHLTANATPNNPDLLDGQVEITYQLVSAVVAGMNQLTVEAILRSNGMPLDLANLPADLAGPGRYPGFLLAWALPQDDIGEPQDFNNIGRRAAQPLSLGLNGFLAGGTTGTHSYDAGTGINTFVVTDGGSQFPEGATLRAVGLQGYFQQAIDGSNISLHALSAVIAVDGDDERRVVVDTMNCANCHEWFEGHGGNRVGGLVPGADEEADEDNVSIQICTLCHNPNQSSSGRTINPNDNPVEGTLGPDILGYPEDAQNFKDLIHGIHSEGFRTRHYEHVRGPTREGYYDWSHITFPRGASTSNCTLCHSSGTYRLPLDEDVLATTVRTTAEVDGLDDAPIYSMPGDPGFPFSTGGVEDAFQGVPNETDWVNTPTASSCFYCHTSDDAAAHMYQNGALLSDPSLPLRFLFSSRGDLGETFESCSVCHGPGKTADVEVVHGLAD